MKGQPVEFTDTQLQEIKNAYLAGDSANAIAKHYGCTHTVINRIAKLGGYKRTKVEAMASKIACNHDYFAKIDTEDKAYWLGFLYADGNVTDGKQPSLQLCLAEQDASHVYAFNQALGSDYNIGHYNYKNPVCQLRIPSKKLVADLTALGCGPRKTFLVLPPTLEQVPSHLVRHFIRGYFDGDGCCNDKQIIFLGTKNLLKWISSNMPFAHRATVKQPRNKSIYRLDVGIMAEAKRQALYSYFYEDATVWLERKRVKLAHAFT